jgi:SAM-dependent methyltransferase
MITRREIATLGLNLDGIGLEIGPSHSPLLAGDPQFRVRTMDYLDQSGLVDKYNSLGVDTSRILPVDYVWDGSPMSQLVGEDRFDWIFSSHVIEHVPDIVEHLRQCATILRPKGVISLIVPDKRFTFDHLRAPSTLATVIDAHLSRRVVPSTGAIVEFLFHQSAIDTPASLTPGEVSDALYRHNADLMQAWLNKAHPDEYVDVHVWSFTSHSFRLLVEELWMLKLIPLREQNFHDTLNNEFFVQLSFDGCGPQIPRSKLNYLALAEAARRT